MYTMIERLFLQILNMSITASYVIIFVILARLVLKRAPKIYSYTLWAVVLFRLLVPFSLSSVYSLLKPIKTSLGDIEHIPINMSLTDRTSVDTVIYSINTGSNGSLPVDIPMASVNPMQLMIFVISVIWIIGILALAGYSFFSYMQLKKKVSTAIRLHDNIYECEDIETPFVLGIMKPYIYLPISLNETERRYVLKHEQIHIKRLDYLVKPVAYLTLCIHWFNPLAWLSFRLVNQDMEMSCDEKVVNELGNEIRKEYSQSLLSMSSDRRINTLSLLAFGESSTKVRIKNLLSYKRPSFWVTVIIVALCGIIGFGLLANPKEDQQDLSFLNPENLKSTILEKDKISVKNHGGTTYLSGNEVISWIEAVDWKEKAVKSVYELAPDYIISINFDKKQEIRLYESEPTLVMVIYGDQWRYYSIKKENYDEILFLVMSKSYFEPDEVELNQDKVEQNNPQSLSNQEIPEEMKQKAIQLVKTVYEIRSDVNSVEIEDNCIVDGKKCYNIYIISKNEFTTTTREIFAVDIGSNTIYLLNRVSGEYEKIATILYKDEIDKYLDVIMSSPKESSNPADYIEKHQKEYQAIISLGDEALTYLKSIWDNEDRGLRGMIVLSLCNEIHPNLNIVSSYSPDTRFYIETYGVDTSITAAGLYPAKGIRLIDNVTKNSIWEMTPGYYSTKFNWSSGSRFVAIYYEARTYGESIVLDTEGMNIIELPKIADLEKITKKSLTKHDSRSDPYFIINKWLNAELIQVDFKWTGENDIFYSGSFNYDIVNKEIRDLQFND